MGFHDGSDSKESACNARDPGLILGSGRSPGGGHGNPLQSSCLENPMDRGAWWATVRGVTESQTGLNTQHGTYIYIYIYIHAIVYKVCDVAGFSFVRFVF